MRASGVHESCRDNLREEYEGRVEVRYNMYQRGIGESQVYRGQSTQLA